MSVKIEMNSISEEQKRMFFPSGKLDEVHVPFESSFEKTMWHIRVLDTFYSSNREPNVVEYSVPGRKYSQIVSAYLVVDFPQIKVNDAHKGKVEIRMKEEYTHKWIRSIETCIDSTPICSVITPLHFTHNMYQKTRNINEYKKDIGDIPRRIEWSDTLPSVTVNFEQPFFYSSSYTKSFPLYALSDKDNLIHRYTFENMSKLIEMRILSEGKWGTPQPVDEKYVDIKEPSQPKLYGHFAVKTDIEIKESSCNDRISYYFDDYPMVSSNVVFKAGTPASVDLKIDGNCRYVSAVVENSVTGEYTNDSGEDLADSVSIHHGVTPVFVKLPSHHFTRSFARDEMISRQPKDIFHVWMTSYNTGDPNPFPGKNLDKLNTNMTLHLKEGTQDTFYVRCIVCVVRELILQRTEKDSSGRFVYKYVN